MQFLVHPNFTRHGSFRFDFRFAKRCPHVNIDHVICIDKVFGPVSADVYSVENCPLGLAVDVALTDTVFQ